MKYETHLLFAFFLSILVVKYFDFGSPYILIPIILLASLIPDIDIPTSVVGKVFKPLSWLLNFIFGHRGFFHSMFLGILVYVLLVFFSSFDIALAFIIGYVSHILLDLLSDDGIALLYPFSKKKINGIITTGSIFETILQWIILAFTTILLFSYVPDWLSFF